MVDPSSQQVIDCRLLAGVARGEQAAFGDLYDRLSGPLYSLCLRMTGEAPEAEDVLQEVFLVIWRRAGSYDAAQSSVFGWAVHLTRCKIIDHLRARGRRLRVLAPLESPAASLLETVPPAPASHHLPPAEAGDTAGSAAEQAATNERAADLRRLLRALPAEQSEVLEMAFFSDLTHHEISARLGQPLGTIKARIRRGLLKLRDQVKLWR